MRNKPALLGFALSVLLVLGVEAFFFTKKVPTVDPTRYARYAVDLEARPGWRYGYLSEGHGAFLVKSPELGQTARAPKTDRGREIQALMTSELRGIPRKTALEVGLYVTILAFLFFGARPLRRIVRGTAPGRFRWLAADTLPGAVAYVLAVFPLLLFGYGYGGFTNLVGPGAFSYSGPYFRWESWVGNSSNSISYRALVSVGVLPAGVLVEIAWMALERLPFVVDLDEIETTWPYWAAGMLAYGGVSVALVRLVGVRRRRKRAGSGLPAI